MADLPKPEHRIALEGPSGRTVAALYPALAWPGRPGAREGLYRVKIDRVWHRPGGVKYVFVTMAEAFAVLSGQAVAPEVSAPPMLPRGTVVRARTPEGGYTLTRTRSRPFQGPDGCWRVFVAMSEDHFLVDELIKQEMIYVRKESSSDVDPCDDPNGSVHGRRRLAGRGERA